MKKAIIVPAPAQGYDAARAKQRLALLPPGAPGLALTPLERARVAALIRQAKRLIKAKGKSGGK